MRILFIIDPLPRQELEWVTSYAMAREFAKRNHKVWCADTPEIWLESNHVHCQAREIFALGPKSYRLGPPENFPARHFDLVLLRKDPPFDLNYLYLTHLLELIAEKTPVVNHPRGIRNTNEKLIGLKFAKWMPETIVTSSPEKIRKFQEKIKSDLVIKPLNDKAGHGVVLLTRGNKRKQAMLAKSTISGAETVMAQRFLHRSGVQGDKRILILNGEILSAYEKRFPKGDFRANLSLGGTFHPAKITARERALVRDLRPYLLREKLYFAGIDVMMEKLIEVNVTSPAGIPESEILYPKLRTAQRLVDFLENLGRR